MGVARWYLFMVHPPPPPTLNNGCESRTPVAGGGDPVVLTLSGSGATYAVDHARVSGLALHITASWLTAHNTPILGNFCYPVGLNWGPFFVRRAGFGVADVDHAHVISQLRTFVRHSLSTVQSQTKPAVTAIPPTKNLSSDRSTNASYSTAAPARASATASAKAIVIRTNVISHYTAKYSCLDVRCLPSLLQVP